MPSFAPVGAGGRYPADYAPDRAAGRSGRSIPLLILQLVFVLRAGNAFIEDSRVLTSGIKITGSNDAFAARLPFADW